MLLLQLFCHLLYNVHITALYIQNEEGGGLRMHVINLILLICRIA